MKEGFGKEGLQRKKEYESLEKIMVNEEMQDSWFLRNWLS